jgi:polar amino acid transport system substrate-binding protein
MSVNITGKFKASALLQVVLLALIAILAPVGASAGADTGDVRPLRLCADPTNLPYSSDDASKPGFYLEVGQAIGKALGRPVTYNWYKTYFGKRSVRVTLLGKQCDAMIGLPLSDDFMGPAVIFSRKISAQTYALVTAKEQVVSSIDDLRGRRVAVQYQTTPQDLLSLRGDIEKVTVLSPEEGMKALDLGTADVAFVWGPVAGWLNKTQYQNRYKLYTVEGRGLSWDAAIGFAKTSKELRDQVDAVLPSLEQTIGDLAAKYGLPGDTSTKLYVSGNSPNLLAPPSSRTGGSFYCTFSFGQCWIEGTGGGCRKLRQRQGRQGSLQFHVRPLPRDRRGAERAADRPPAVAASLRRKCARDVLDNRPRGAAFERHAGLERGFYRRGLQ